MTWSTLQPTCANRERSTVPEYGVRVHVTGRMATGPKSRGGYTALTIGKHLATTLGLHRANEMIGISVGSGENAGKISVYARDSDGFPGKKQVTGAYVFALGFHTTKDVFAVQFEPFVIERAQVDFPSKVAVIDIPAQARAA